MNTYLKDVDFNYVGDIEMYPGHRADANGKPVITEEMRDIIKHVNEQMKKEKEKEKEKENDDSIDSIHIINIMRSLSEPSLSSKLNKFNV
jgi:hypothetical protein